jgi:hypothetical protein
VVTRHHLPTAVRLPFPLLTLAVASEKIKGTGIGTGISTGIGTGIKDIY